MKGADLLNRFFSHSESDERDFHCAMNEFKNQIPDLAQSFRHSIADRREEQKFREAFAVFVTLCRVSLNPDLSDDKVDEIRVAGMQSR